MNVDTSGQRLITALSISFFLLISSLGADGLYFEKRDFSNLTIPSVNCIVQDDRGYIWVGTPGGLLRYDSRTPRLINRKNLPVLPSDNVLSLGFDNMSGELWIGTAAGIVRYNLKTNSFQRVLLRYGTSMKISSEVVSIAVLGEENIYAVSGNSIVHLQDDNNMVEVPVDSAAPGTFIEVYCVVSDAEGNLWALASDGLKLWDKGLLRFKHIKNLNRPLSLTAIGTDLWIGNNPGGGLLRYSPGTGELVNYDVPGAVVTVSADSEKRIWAGTDSDGLYIVNPDSGQIKICSYDPEHPYKLSSKRITSLFPGGDGHVWVGTADTGLLSVDINKHNHLAFFRKSGAGRIPSGSEQAIFEDSLGYIWIGSDTGGLSRLDPLSGDIQQYVHNPDDMFSIVSDHISDIVEDDTGRLWVGTDQGPVFYVPEVDGFESAGNMISGWPDFRGKKVLAMEQGRDDSIWISFQNDSLYKLNLQDRDYLVFNYPVSSVPSVLFTDSRGFLWAGSGKNLRLYNKDGELIKTWAAKGIENGGIPFGGITDIFSDSKGNIWLGGPSGAFVYTGFDEGFQSLNIPSASIINVSGIAEDNDGYIWIADGRQLHIFSSDAVYQTSMGSDSGFTPAGLITAVFHSRDGTIYVGANNEIWTYRSYIDTPPLRPPEVFLNGLNVMNEQVLSGYALDSLGYTILKSDEKVFSISYESVDYRYQGSLKYQYRLSGFNDSWVDNGSNDSVTFANLSPGTYFFSVRAVNELGDISSNEASLRIDVEKSYWQKTPAIIFYIILAASLFFVFLKIWEGRLMKAQIAELEEARMKIVEVNKKLAFLSLNDSLTDLLNRRGFDKSISHALDTARRNSQLVTMFMMDVDFFKKYNDNYGHVRGDDALRSVGRALRQVFGRSTDIIARYGGEEFAAVFAGDNPQASVTLANDLITAIKKLKIVHEFSSVSDYLTLSAGSATLKAERIESVESFINRADDALYAAKEGGRNRICFSGILPRLPGKMVSGIEPLVYNEGAEL